MLEHLESLDKDFFELLSTNVEESNRDMETAWSAFTVEDHLRGGDPTSYISPERQKSWLAMVGEDGPAQALMQKIIDDADARFHGTEPRSKHAAAEFTFHDDGSATAMIGY